MVRRRLLYRNTALIDLRLTLPTLYIKMFFFSQIGPMGHRHQTLISVSLFNFYVGIFVIAVFLIVPNKQNKLYFYFDNILLFNDRKGIRKLIEKVAIQWDIFYSGRFLIKNIVSIVSKGRTVGIYIW